MGALERVCPICGGVRENVAAAAWGRGVRAALGTALVLLCAAALWALEPWERLTLSVAETTPIAVSVRSPTVAPTRTATQPPTATASATPTLTSTPPPSHTPTAAYEQYTVARGDSLSVIAQKFGVSVEVLQSINGMARGAILTVGQEVLIPLDREGPPLTTTPSATPTRAALVHTVEQGDTLGDLAVEYDVSSEAIAEVNDMSINSVLSIGQELLIPGLTATPTMTMTLSPMPTVVATSTWVPLSITRIAAPKYPYAQPRLLGPVDGTRIDGDAESVLLNWTSVGVLEDDEWYLLRIARPSSDAITIMTTATSWRMTRGMYPDGEPGGGNSWRVHWQVTVVQYAPSQPDAIPLSMVSETRVFTWG